MKKERFKNFMVHFETDGHMIFFEAYPVQDWVNFETGEKGTSYISKTKDPDTIDVFKHGECLMKLEGSFCWRGVWEGRLYFPDMEYFGEEIKELSELYNDFIVPFCKDFIQKRDKNDYDF